MSKIKKSPIDLKLKKDENLWSGIFKGIYTILFRCNMV
jgi:hypothetical protein